MIRGDPSEDAVLCTDDKTFELRIADTSNALLITPTLILHKDAGKSRTIIILGDGVRVDFHMDHLNFFLSMQVIFISYLLHWSSTFILYVMPNDSWYLSQPQTAGPLAQSAERRADNAKVVSSSLTWTTELFFLHTVSARERSSAIWEISLEYFTKLSIF